MPNFDIFELVAICVTMSVGLAVFLTSKFTMMVNKIAELATLVRELLHISSEIRKRLERSNTTFHTRIDKMEGTAEKIKESIKDVQRNCEHVKGAAK